MIAPICLARLAPLTAPGRANAGAGLRYSAQLRRDGASFAFTDRPTNVAVEAVSIDLAAPVQQIEQHTARITLLTLFWATFRKCRNECDLRSVPDCWIILLARDQSAYGRKPAGFYH